MPRSPHRIAALATALACTACQPSVEQQAAAARSTIDRYCTGCHDDAERAGDVTLQRVSLTDVAAQIDLWEDVVRQVRGGMMPPSREPLPDADTARQLTAYIEERLDAAAAAHPNPPRKTLRRLSRAEYANAVRDLLAVDIDADALLPGDAEPYGGANAADVLAADPALQERYQAAARRIAAEAVGDVGLESSSAVYRVPADRTQTDHVEGLPFGTRGGLLVSHYFPVEGEYAIRPKLWRSTRGVVRGTETPHELEISLDGARVKLARFGGPAEEIAARTTPGKTGDDIDRRLEARVAVSAGSHDIGVAFAKKSSAPQQEVLQPFERDKLDPRLDTGLPDLDQVIVEGPLKITGPGKAPSRQRIFSCHPEGDTAAAVCADEILTRLARLAYRRPIAAAEREQLKSAYAAARANGRGFEDGVQAGLAHLLAAPQFLFRSEQDPPGTKPGGVYRLSQLEIASRLAFFLWNSIPDDALLDAATSGRLGEPDELESQVRRMLADDRASSLARDFANQWLGLRKLRTLTPDAYVFPDFDDNLRESAIRETELLFETVVREDRPIIDLLAADFTFMNERLAKHYGVDGVYGDQFRRVDGIEEPRRGLLGQASVLTLSSLADRTSPSRRGAYVLANILGTPPPERPPDAPLLPDAADGKRSLRARLERHRADPACAGCHALFDPLGIALENFDAIGRWRDEDAGEKIQGFGDTIHVLRRYGWIYGAAELRDALLTDPDRFTRTAIEKLMTYALGRPLTAADMPAARGIARAAAEQEYRFSALVLGVVQSEPFQMRKAGAPAGAPIGRKR